MLRFVASVLITSGILMLADAGLTLAWQEPISAFIAAREQDQLRHELNAYARNALPRERLLVAAIRGLRHRLAKLAEIERKRAKTGHPIGRIELPTLGRHYVVVQGTAILTLQYFILLPPFAWLAKRAERREPRGWTPIPRDRSTSPTSQY